MGATTGSVEIVALDQLSRRDLEAWHSLRNANPQLDSPYFHPEFARAVHESGTPVHVVVERDDSGVRRCCPGTATDRCSGRSAGRGPTSRRPITRAGRHRRPAPAVARHRPAELRVRPPSRGAGLRAMDRSPGATRRTSTDRRTRRLPRPRIAERQGQHGPGPPEGEEGGGGTWADHVRRRTARTPTTSAR